MVTTAYQGPDERYIGHFEGNNLNNQRSNLYWKKQKSRRRSPGGGDIITFPRERERYGAMESLTSRIK